MFIWNTAAPKIPGTVSNISRTLEEILKTTAEEPPLDLSEDDSTPLTLPEDDPVPEPLPVEEVTAEQPEESTGSALLLTHAHLVALWKRSCYPISGLGLILFGIRGARPVDYSGTPFAASHELMPATVNYLTMNCTIGQWSPGDKTLAVFPGSTVPFQSGVKKFLGNNGVGVNQMGRGRYDRYSAGWHTRKQNRNGHWALRQECAITLQRTADDLDFDLHDRWETGKIAGDNIHCAFGMGDTDDRIPDHAFSSLGCQVIAGMVTKGQPGSESGPWKKFIEPFQKIAGRQQQAEYVLFSEREVIVTR